MNAFNYLVPSLALVLILFSAFKKINVYQTFLGGVKECLPLLYNLFAPILCVLFMSELFKLSGLEELVLKVISPLFKFLQIPPEIAPLVILKPFSGSGSLAILKEILVEYGANSYLSLTAIAVFGSSETTFYVLAVYFGAVGITKIRYALIIGLLADFIGIVAAVSVCNWMFA